MGAIDDELADELISSSLDLARLEAGLRARVLAILERMQAELVAKLAAADLTAFNKARTQSFLRQLADVIDRYYGIAQGEVDLTLSGVAEVQAAHTARALNSAFPVHIGATLPTETFLVRLAGNALTQGAVMSDWWARLASDTAFKVSNEIRQGLAQGETTATIIARLIGKRGEPGVLETSRRNAAAIVQTGAQAVGNEARLETYRKNQDVIVALRWVTTLDARVCPLCAARADLTWANDDEHKPIGHKIAFQNPPIHWQDRCILAPITDSGFQPRHRASADGPVRASMTFEAWLSRRSKEQQEEQLGVGRADLWRRGKITLQQLLSVPRGNVLSLEALRAKYGP